MTLKKLLFIVLTSVCCSACTNSEQAFIKLNETICNSDNRRNSSCIQKVNYADEQHAIGFFNSKGLDGFGVAHLNGPKVLEGFFEDNIIKQKLHQTSNWNIISYSNKNIYFGETKLGSFHIRHGVGAIYSSNKLAKIGVWQDGELLYSLEKGLNHKESVQNNSCKSSIQLFQHDCIITSLTKLPFDIPSSAQANGLRIPMWKGKPNGRVTGTLISDTEAFEIDVKVIDDKREGTGQFHHTKNNIQTTYEINFVDDKAIDGKIFYENQRNYKGQVVEAKHLFFPDGYGILSFSDGTTYEGEFTSGKPNGYVKIDQGNKVSFGTLNNGYYQGKQFVFDKEKNIAGWVYIVDGNAISESEFYKLHSDMASPVFELSQEELCEIKELRLNGSSYGDKYNLEIERRGISCLK